MPAQDRDKWNAKYTADPDAWISPSCVVTQLAKYLPDHGRAIDVAGGAGRHAVWMAQHGLDVSVADVSPVGLTLAKRTAERAATTLQTIEVDLEHDAFPAGPWDVILSHHFLWRPLFPIYPDVLAMRGRLVIVQPTVTNLQRHDRPPRQFLLNAGELPSLVGDLDIIHYEEDWLDEGRHEAVLVAERNS